MNFTTWYDFLTAFMQKIINAPGKKAYLVKLINNIEKHKAENKNLPFRIEDIKKEGFIIKVAGLYGYISFYHMPWKYNNIDSWRAIFPVIIGKVFFCKVHHIKKDPISVVIDGEIPQFKKPELIDDEIYKGIIINKTNYNVFIDFGYHFKWNYGSIVGSLHISGFDNPQSFDSLKTGQLFEACFWGHNEKSGQLIIGTKPELKGWVTGEIEKLIGQTVQVKVLKTTDNDTKYYLVDGNHEAYFQVTKLIYPEYKAQIKKALPNLKNEEIIHCKVLSINKKKRLIQLKWDTVLEIEAAHSRKKKIPNKPKKKRNKNSILKERKNTIQNILDSDTIEKLKLLGNQI